MKITNKVELMAPAGDFESLQAALDNGADSIYFGVEQLNMRARSTVNFSLEDLPTIAQRCTEKDVRSYLTLNTIVYDHDLSMIYPWCSRLMLQASLRSSLQTKP